MLSRGISSDAVEKLHLGLHVSKCSVRRQTMTSSHCLKTIVQRQRRKTVLYTVFVCTDIWKPAQGDPASTPAAGNWSEENQSTLQAHLTTSCLNLFQQPHLVIIQTARLHTENAELKKGNSRVEETGITLCCLVVLATSDINRA